MIIALVFLLQVTLDLPVVKDTFVSLSTPLVEETKEDPTSNNNTNIQMNDNNNKAEEGIPPKSMTLTSESAVPLSAEMSALVAGGNNNENDDNSNRDEEKDVPSTQHTEDPMKAMNIEAAPTPTPESSTPSFWTKLCNFYTKNSFLILALLAILLAYAYPKLGNTYLVPQITATWIAVIIIFFLSGLSLKSEEFKNALQRLRFNLFVQIYNFAFVSVFMFGVTRFIVYIGAISQSLADGMMICSCVPITVNMVLVLTKSSKGDEASAIFNAAFGNMLGVFISPLLILLYLGQTASVALGTVFIKLCLRVVVPIIIGQIFHNYSMTVVNFVKENKKVFKKIQEYCLIFIVYTVFCRTFYQQRQENDNANTTKVTDAIVMICFQFLILSSVMYIAWMLLKILYPNEPTLRVMGLYGCTHKSVAMGIPLINAIYEDNPNIGFYTLPLLIWHPMQLVIGTFLSPRLASFVDSEEERIRSESGRQDGREDVI